MQTGPEDTRDHGRRTALPEVGVRELKVHASSLIRLVEGGQRLVVTRQRRPVALLIPISEAREFVLAYAEEFVEMRRIARDEYAAGRAVGDGRVRVATGALEAIREPGFPVGAARLVLGQIARRERSALGERPRRWEVIRTRDGDIVVARAGHHRLVCELPGEDRTL